MKYLYLAMLLLALLLACIDDEAASQLEPAATIGADALLCGCSENWLIQIGTATYRFFHLPNGSNTSLQAADLPVDVLVDWEPVIGPCHGDEIELIYLEKKMTLGQVCRRWKFAKQKENKRNSLHYGLFGSNFASLFYGMVAAFGEKGKNKGGTLPL